MKTILLPAVLALGLTGCTSIAGWLTDRSPTLTSVDQGTKKALTAAHALHDAFALSASAAAKSGACTNDCATKVKHYLDGSAKLLTDADGLSNPADIMADIDAATRLISDAKGLVQ
jgi:hypothetical protein